MVDRDTTDAWMAGYERAWRTAGTESLGDLFAADATYRMSPYEEPAQGLAAIERLWEEEREGPDEPFVVSHEVVAIDGEMVVVRVDVTYDRDHQPEYRDLWILRFAPDGRCREFEEWAYWPEIEIPRLPE